MTRHWIYHKCSNLNNLYYLLYQVTCVTYALMKNMMEYKSEVLSSHSLPPSLSSHSLPLIYHWTSWVIGHWVGNYPSPPLSIFHCSLGLWKHRTLESWNTQIFKSALATICLSWVWKRHSILSLMWLMWHGQIAMLLKRYFIICVYNHMCQFDNTQLAIVECMCHL